MVRLSEEQKQFYKDNGYILLKNVLSEEELSRVIDEYDKLYKRKNLEAMENSWVGECKNNRKSDSPYTIKGIHNLQHHHAVFAKFLYNESMLDALEDIMGTENIMLHLTKAYFKLPEKGSAFLMHQDYPDFPYQKHSMVTVFWNLDAANRENGSLCVYPGSHKLGPLEDIGHYVDQTKYPLEKATVVEAERGDIVIFSYLLIHGSLSNNSDHPIRMVIAQFASADDKPVGDQKQQPGYGLMVRGANLEKDGAISKRFE